MPGKLLQKLIDGGEIGGKTGVSAIGEDYKELERRQVVHVVARSPYRFTMKLIKKDVGELALAIIRGNAAAQEALLMEGSSATGFKGPAETHHRIRKKHVVSDNQFITSALESMRSGG